MHQQRRPSKRYSSYVPPSDLSSLEDSVMLMPTNSESSKCEPSKNQRSSSTGSTEEPTRRRSLNTLHFDALQNAVSRLARIDDFHLEELGYGFFSDVFKVTHKQSGKVMVLKRNKNTNSKLNILREVQLMNRLSHPNILKFMGVCVHQGQLHGLTEFINGGDLDQFVQKWNNPVSWMVRTNLALDVSHGVNYLHSMNIFHRDLTAKNCLVRETKDNSKGKMRYSAVVADLGLAEKIPSTPEEESKLKVVGTPYYMAPEVLLNKPYNQISDVFSFGIILCQLIICTSSDPEKLPRSNDFGIARDLLLAMLTKGDGAPMSPSNKPIRPPNSFLQLMFDCCEVDAAKRPNMSTIVRVLKETRSSLESEKQEKRRLKSKKHPDLAKRHSTVLSELPSFSADYPKLSEEIPPSNKTGPNKENGLNIAEPSVPHKNANAKGKRRRSSESRLSRSYSDISSEIISHAKSIIASSREKMATEATDADMDTMVETLNEAFFNPFDMFDISEDQGKLFDDPSSDVLEMTFDLPSPKPAPGSPARVRRAYMRHKYGRRLARPKSLVIDNQAMGSAINLDSGESTPDPHPVHGLPSSCPPSPLTPEPLQTPPQRGKAPLHTQLKQAVMRSIILSPQGCRLLSWWSGQGRGSDMKSISSVFSLMSDKCSSLQRSISLPNIAMMRETMSVSRNSPRHTGSPPLSASNHKPPSRYRFHNAPAYVTLPRIKSRKITTETLYKQRSSTADDVFQDTNLLEILPEESRTAPELPPNLPSGSLDESLIAVKSGSTGDLSLPPCETEINNNMAIKGAFDTRKNSVIECMEEKNEKTDNIDLLTLATSTDPQSNKSFQNEKVLHSPDAKTMPGVADSTEGSISSSSSSGASSSGMKITLTTGAMCSNRRKNVKYAVPKLEENEVTSKSNRDSGYNEDVNISEHSHYDHASHFHKPASIAESKSSINSGSLTPKRGCSAPKCLNLESSMSDLTLMGASDLIESHWKVGDPEKSKKQLVYQMR